MKVLKRFFCAVTAIILTVFLSACNLADVLGSFFGNFESESTGGGLSSSDTSSGDTSSDGVSNDGPSSYVRNNDAC